MSSYPISKQCQFAYPEISRFSETFNQLEFQQKLRSSLKESIAPLSLALAMPFCAQGCRCCYHDKIVAANLPSLREYLDHLMIEIDLHSQWLGPHHAVLQLHFAGAPSCLEGAEITELMHYLASRYHLVDDKRREYSIEINTQAATRNSLALYKGLGFNHLNFTVSDFSLPLGKSINRSHSFDSVKELTEAARLHQFSSLNYNLVYGLAGQTMSALATTLDQLISLSPDRIFLRDALSFYSYCAAENQNFHQSCAPSEEEKQLLFAVADEKLLAAGYQSIGMECYVKPTDSLVWAQQRGFLQYNGHGYTACKTMGVAGLGVSSYSALQFFYTQNEGDIKSYFQRLDNNELPIARGVKLSADEKLRHYVVSQLVCNHWCDIGEVERAFSVVFSDYFSREMAALSALEQEGLIFWQGRVLRVAKPVRLGLAALCGLFGHAHLDLVETGVVAEGA
ncbi:MAG: radical SAM protein [Spongiibacteraceae bacterium]